jgi:hypothetical protein
MKLRSSPGHESACKSEVVFILRQSGVVFLPVLPIVHLVRLSLWIQVVVEVVATKQQQQYVNVALAKGQCAAWSTKAARPSAGGWDSKATASSPESEFNQMPLFFLCILTK